MYASKTPLLMLAAITAFGILSAPVGAAETAADVPKDSYYNDPLTAAERSGIAQEENVSPNDGRASVPNAADDGVIPDAADKADRKAATETPEQNRKEDVDRGAVKGGESEADAILDESKKDFKVIQEGSRRLHEGLGSADADEQGGVGRELPHDARVLPGRPMK